MDSSTIVGVATHFLKLCNKHLITFSATGDADSPKEINGRKLEDERYIQAVIEFNAIETPVFVNKELWNNLLDEADFNLMVNDGLEEYTQGYLNIIKHEAMQRNARTMLSGFPGDEMATYVGAYYYMDYFDKGEYIKYFKNKTKYPFKKIKPFISADIAYFLHKLRNIAHLYGAENRLASLMQPVPLYYRFIKGDMLWKDLYFRERYKSYRHFQKYRLLKPQVPMRMENETRFGLYFKTEPRFPMADIRLTQFFLSMPNSIKYEGTMERSAWRKAIGQYIPRELLERTDKFGMMAPFRHNSQTEQKRLAVLQEGLNHLRGNTKDQNYHAAQSLNKKKAMRHIEIIRFLEKNFENI